MSELEVGIENGVATITFNRPEVMNAFSDGMRRDLLALLERFDQREEDDVRVIVITGAGGAFSAGGDVASMRELQDRDDSNTILDRLSVASQIVELMPAMRQPIVAAINGAAAGGGMNLALACDLRIASERAIFSEAFVKIGLLPDWGGLRSLTRIVGTAKAMELMMTGDRIDAAQAASLGLVNRVVEHEALAATAADLARALAAGPLDALAAIKRGVHLGAEGSISDVLAYEYRAQKRLFLSGDAREGMRAFLEKRPPRFGGG